MAYHKYTYNHIALYDDANDVWNVYHKLDKDIPKTVECYGTSNIIATGKTLVAVLDDAVINHNIPVYDIEVIEDE